MLKKKKRRALVVREDKPKKKLSPTKQYVLREMALRLFVDKRMKKTQVARYLKTTVATLNGFFEDPEFAKDLAERIDNIHGVDEDFRIDQSKNTLFSMYEELIRRTSMNELGEVDTPQLHKMIVNTQKELRLDTPGGFTSKVGVSDLGKLQDRFERSLSGKMQRMKKASGQRNFSEEEDDIDEEADAIDCEIGAG